MTFDFLTIVLLAAAIAWVTTVVVYKYGPFGILQKFRWTLDRWLGSKEANPFNCHFCASFWVGLVICAAWAINNTYINAFIQFLGVIGVSMAIRSQFNEWGD